jgi:hypothetical protein
MNSSVSVTLPGKVNVPVNPLRPLNARTPISVNQAENLMDESSPAAQNVYCQPKTHYGKPHLTRASLSLLSVSHLTHIRANKRISANLRHAAGNSQWTCKSAAPVERPHANLRQPSRKLDERKFTRPPKRLL